jgi:hypothetical protein
MNLRYPQRHAFADKKLIMNTRRLLAMSYCSPLRVLNNVFTITYRIVKELSDPTIRTKLTHSSEIT